MAMKPALTVIAWLATALVAVGQPALPTPDPAPGPREEAPSIPSSPEALQPQPPVRFPGNPIAESPAVETSAPVAPVASGQIGWTGSAVALREPSVTAPRTNTPLEMRGVVPKLSRTERRTFGGFVTGFANLFNPLAPTQEGTAASTEHWYDAEIRPRPLPSAFRDERFHEAKFELIAVGLEGDEALGKKPRRR